jgi:hypothetical protein
MMSSMKQLILNNVKNVWGWKTPRKIVVFAVDDYGNVRLDSRKAREELDKAGLKVLSRFDAFDTLETREDLDMLHEALSSVKDKNGKHAVFTPFAVPCNIDFERMTEEKYAIYRYELLPLTFEKLAACDTKAYDGAWNLWKEGIANGLMAPQFHGREHFNLKVFEEKLAARDHEIMTCLKNRSYTSISESGYATIGYTSAFDFWKFEENERFANIIKEGLDAFEQIFGYRAKHLTPPGGREHQVIHQCLRDAGIKYIDTPIIKLEHQGKGKYKKSINYTGKKNYLGMIYGVRNVVFEPTHDRGFDWINYSLRQIASAFRWHRPAIVSSHRVNFCGHISPENRKQGIEGLKRLLKEIVARWPDVEFMSSGELMDMIKVS